MKALTDISNESLIITDHSLDNLIDRFINSQDVKQSSRDTYRKALKAFTVWLSP